MSGEAERSRDEAQALVGDIRAILGRGGKRLDLIREKLAGYTGDLDLQGRRLRERESHDSNSAIVRGARAGKP